MGYGGFRNPGLGSINSTGEKIGNINIQKEDDFSVLIPGTYVWDEDEFYFKTGDVFPTPSEEKRANIYKTNDALYNSNLEDVYQSVFSWNDRIRDMVTSQEVSKIAANLPDFKGCTESWVDLGSAKPPRVDGSDSSKILRLSNILTNSNFAEINRSAWRGTLFMYGNKVFRVDRLHGGNVKCVEMPLKCWIPFVNRHDVSTIEVNVIFNIFKNRDGMWYVEFICYHEDGRIKKYTYGYNKSTKRLLDLVEETEYEEAFDGAGISPIVVFTGNSLNGSVFGSELYSDWDASISSCIRAYESILLMVERAKEITRVVPADATDTDDYSGYTYLRQTGAIAYKDMDKVPKVEYVVSQINMEPLIQAYQQALDRLARDTGLSSTFFSTSELKSNTSGETLKTSMYRTELKSKSYCTLMSRPLKSMVYKMGIAAGLDIEMSDFDLVMFNGFIQDVKEQMEIIQSRLGSNGNVKTMSTADAISQYDDVPMSQAVIRAKELEGIVVEMLDEDVVSSDSGGESEVTAGITFTHGEDNNNTSNSKGDNIEAYQIGPQNIGGE